MMVLTVVLWQCFIVKLLTKPILLLKQLFPKNYNQGVYIFLKELEIIQSNYSAVHFNSPLSLTLNSRDLQSS